MNRFPLLALAAVALLSATACDKDKTNTPTPNGSSTEQRLTANTWRMTAATATPGIQLPTGQVITDLYGFFPPCGQDDTQRFLSGGQLRVDEGATKCDATDPQTQTGTWTLAQTSGNNMLTTTIDGQTSTLKVESLNDTELKLSRREDVFQDGQLTTVTLTLTKQ